MKDHFFKEIEDYFDDAYFRRGLSYARSGRVLEVRRDEKGVLTAKVLGSGGKTYRQSIVREEAGVDGSCSCPVGWNCKHVAAALIVFEKNRHDPPPAPANAQGHASSSGRLTKGSVSAWMEDVERALKSATKPGKTILYLLDLHASEKRAIVTAVVGDIRKDGSLGAFKTYRAANAAGSGPAQFLDPADIALLRQLHGQSPNWYGREDFTRLFDTGGAATLEALAATGRLHWRMPEGVALAWGPDRAGAFGWALDTDGTQRLEAGAATDEIILPLTPPYYVDEKTGTLGRLALPASDKLAQALLKSPALNQEDADQAFEHLRTLVPGLPPPVKVARRRETNVAPVPHLRLFPLHVSYPPEGMPSLPVASLEFDYRGARVPYEKKPRPVVRREDDNAIVEIIRNEKKEEQARKALERAGLAPMTKYRGFWRGIEPEQAHHFVMEDSRGGMYGQSEILTRWLDFLGDGVAQLRAEGWVVDIDPGFPLRAVTLAGAWDINIEEGSGIDWFNLSLSAQANGGADGGTVDLLPIMIGMARNFDNQSFSTLMDSSDDSKISFPAGEPGTFFTLPVGRIRPILRLLRDLWMGGKIGREGDELRLSRLDAGLLADMEAASGAARLRWHGGETLRETGRRLKDFRGVQSVKPPKTLKAVLRPYQQEGLDWLAFLEEYGFNGVLADDMGLGKTVQTLAWLAHAKEKKRLDRPALIVAPTSLMHNWRQEADTFTPNLKVLTLQGLDRKGRFGDIAEHDIVLTTYPLLPRDKDVLLQQEFHAIILDEAQFIKNSKARMAQIVQQLKGRHRLCLTGTPLENHLGELWSLFHFLQPGFLGDEATFRAAYRRPIEKESDAERRDSLARRIRPFLLRRTKEQVAADLPPKTELLRTADLNAVQRDLYETVRLSMHERVRREIAEKGMARSHIVVLDALLKLRQICCDPRLLKLDSAKKVKAGSAKLDMLAEMLPALIGEGRRILLFSQFTEMLALIEKECAALDIPYVILTGKTKDRKTPIDSFQQGKVPLFLISLKAGGTGLNLTAADTVIHYDPWWNPAVERQATDRAHRIGQDKPVFVYKLLTSGTVEEKILELQQRKRALADALFDPAKAAGAKLTEKDIAALFEPLRGEGA